MTEPGVVEVWDAVAKVPAGPGVRSLAEVEAEKERLRVEQERRDRRNARRRYRRATRKADSTAPPVAERPPAAVVEPVVPARPVDPRIARAAARDAAWRATAPDEDPRAVAFAALSRRRRS